MRLLGNLAGVFATLGAVALLALVLSLWRISSGLPNYEHLANYTPPVMSRVHAGDGSLIAEYAQERRLFVPIDVVPEHVINAFWPLKIKISTIISALISSALPARFFKTC